VEADPADLDRAAGLLRAAKRPLIAAGGGAVQSGAWNEVASLARLLRAPVLMTPESKGIISARDPLAFEWMAAPDLIPAADVVLAVGTRYANPSTKRRPVPLGQSFIRIDADPFEIQLVPSTAVAIAGDARRCLGGLLAALGSTESSASAWDQQQLVAIREKCAAIVASIHPQAEFGAALREELPDDAVVIHGMTQLGYWARYGFPVYEPRTFIGPGYMGALGFEVATGLGAQAADRDRKVVVIAGDGGFMFNVQELATAVQHQLNAILVVFNDSAFGNVRRIQQVSYGARYIATDLRNPDFVKLAEAFGVRGIKADGPQGLRLALRQALSLSGPVLIEVPVGQMDDLRRINPKT
jgi:acetolactate synthase-1/2/3 large subunit